MADSKNIVFLASKSEADIYNEAVLSKVRRPADEAIIAMNPSVYAYLKKKSLSPENTLSYFTNESHVKLLKASEAMFDWLRDKADLINTEIGVRYAYVNMFVYCIRFTLLGYLWMIEVVLNAIEKYNPKSISASLSGGRAAPGLYIEPGEKYLGYLVKAIAGERGLDFDDLTGTAAVAPAASPGKGRFRDIFNFLVKLEGFKFQERKIRLTGILIGRKKVFFTSPLYRLDKFALELRNRHPRARFYLFGGPVIPPPGFKDSFFKFIYFPKHMKYIEEQRTHFDDLIAQIEREKGLFSYRGISFSVAVAKKIRDRFVDFLLGLMLWAFEIRRFVERIKPSAFVSNGNRADDVILAEICRQKGIPVILISHGSHIGPKGVSEGIEWGEHGKMLMSAPFSHLALQTPVSEGYLKDFPSSSVAVKTGPLIWGLPVNRENSESLFAKISKGKYKLKDVRVIMHAGTPKPSNSLRLYVYETPDEYVNALCNLAKTVEKIPDTVLIIKFRPWPEISADDLKMFVPFSEKVILSIDEPFLDVLGISDLLVSFSSTTIEEALQNRIPVLLYGGGGRYQHIPACEINGCGTEQRSALYHVKGEKELECAIRDILRLKIDGRGRDRALFNPYIYEEDARQRIDDFLRI